MFVAVSLKGINVTITDDLTRFSEVWDLSMPETLQPHLAVLYL